MRRALALGTAAFAAEKLYTRANALDLHGKRAVVTGGSRGLGFALAQELRAQGRASPSARAARSSCSARRPSSATT